MGSQAIPPPTVRRKTSVLCAALVVGVLGAAAALVAPTSHAAESTLGSAAAQSGRYFGTAIASGRL
ncbi:1,4-beta-xylanase, partial [Streptomyces sp. NPDC059956]